MLESTGIDGLKFEWDGTDTTLEIDKNNDTVAEHTVTFDNTNMFSEFGQVNNDSAGLVTEMIVQNQLIVNSGG